MQIVRLMAPALSIALVAGACSSDGASPDSYYADLQGIISELDGALDEIEGSFNAGLLDINFETTGADQQLIVLFQTSISGVNGSFSQLVEGLETLEPPTDLAGPHQEAVAAGRQVLADYAARADQLDAIATVADIDAYAEALSTSVARNRFVESCRELQGIADRDEIEVNLNC